MVTVKMMVVPGRICRIESEGSLTVEKACQLAQVQIPEVDWLYLAKDREVRVNNIKMSNVREIPSTGGYVGYIGETALRHNDVVMIMTKIKGNGDGALSCTINGKEYALETPQEVSVVLSTIAGIDMDDVMQIVINGIPADDTQLVGMGDVINVKLYDDDDSEAEADDGEITVVINGKEVSGKPADIKKLLC